MDHLRMTVKAEQVKLLRGGGAGGGEGRRRIMNLHYAVIQLFLILCTLVSALSPLNTLELQW
jgi:hypothetical protein